MNTFRFLRGSLLLLLTFNYGWTQSQTAADSAAAAPAAPVSTSGVLTPIPFPTDTQDAEYARSAGVQAIRQWVGDFQRRDTGLKRFAVLPLGRDIDGDYFTDQVRNQMAEQGAGTGYTLYTRDDATWRALLDEIRRGDQLGDTMDPTTIQKFGRVQGVEGIVLGRISGIFVGSQTTDAGPLRIEGEGKVIQVRVSLQAYAVETGQLLWGGERIGAVVMPAEDYVIKRDWILLGAAGVGGLLLLLFIIWFLMRMLKSANRPR